MDETHIRRGSRIDNAAMALVRCEHGDLRRALLIVTTDRADRF
jgi:hypothetical protein